MVILNIFTKIVTPAIFVDESTDIECNATRRKYKIRRSTLCNSKNVIYVAYFIKCMKQGVCSTTSYLGNYAYRIKKAILKRKK